jgi:hypothetical protein
MFFVAHLSGRKPFRRACVNPTFGRVSSLCAAQGDNNWLGAGLPIMAYGPVAAGESRAAEQHSSRKHRLSAPHPLSTAVERARHERASPSCWPQPA